ncbi:MAG: hypothetical protein CL607_17725 [Anaerolineaceae bacterium]|nr:hypothetical protein [Anaerolineaceae bacterium]
MNDTNVDNHLGHLVQSIQHLIQWDKDIFSYSMESAEEITISKDISNSSQNTEIINLLQVLIRFSYNISIDIRLDDQQYVQFDRFVVAEQNKIKATVDPMDLGAFDSSSLEDSTVMILNRINDWIEKNISPQVDDILEMIGELASDNTFVSRLTINYVKSSILNRYPDLPFSLTLFFSAQKFVDWLKSADLQQFEHKLVDHDKDIVVFVLDQDVDISGDKIRILGKSSTENFQELLSNAYQIDLHKTVREFSRDHTIWINPVSSLTPYDFDVTNKTPHGLTNLCKTIIEQLQILQSLLSLIFLADRIENISRNNKVYYALTFVGLRRLPLEIDIELITSSEYRNDVYSLFKYAYEDLLADKLEIVQQFISIVASDNVTLLSRAKEIQEMSKKTYDRKLVDKVAEYFNARVRIEDKLEEISSETGKVTLELTDNLTNDIYKLSGVLVIGFATALLKPDVTLLALSASLFVAIVYILVVRYWHLPVQKQIYDLRVDERQKQLKESFGIFLRENDIESHFSTYMDGPKNLFNEKYKQTTERYCISIVVFIVVIIVILVVLHINGLVFVQSVTPSSLSVTIGGP